MFRWSLHVAQLCGQLSRQWHNDARASFILLNSKPTPAECSPPQGEDVALALPKGQGEA
jgi:hypothetical protein